MSEIKVKLDDLEEFAGKIGKVERECDEALEALNWHFTSLLANFPGMLPDSIHALEYELRYSINEYKNKLDEAQRLIRLTAAEMEKDEQKMGNKVSEFLLELVGWNDAKRIVSEYDPVTGEKLSFGDRVLAGGFLALSLLPQVKAVGVGGKTLIKGVDAGIPALAKTPGVLKKIRNVLDPKKVQQAFRSVYDQVVNAPIALTKVWFDTIKKEIGEIRLPQIVQEAYAGIGAAERTVKDAFSDAKDLIQRIKNTKIDELDVRGVTKGIGNVNRLIPGTPGVVTGGNSNKLGKNMIEDMGLKRSTNWSGYQAQHIIPSEMANNPVIQKIGMNFDDSSNGIFLRVPDNDISTMSRHRGYHSVYNEVVERALNKMDINQSVDSLQKQVYELQSNLRRLQEKGLPLYPSQGANVELWERKLKQLEK
ncbi:AHH domain-containing protein [Caldibacillus thermoamylovorans]|uniref:AHH domain-containing protein n=1 Tax=Caldibacillus thermoamylovorans TaxID=35841 RepID=UPI0022E67CCE|nr:AHH domain-containing protein [Caldibacillus thermoamylovorans]